MSDPNKKMPDKAAFQTDSFPDDVEGHRVAAADGTEDLEGHRLSLTDDDDVEGHRLISTNVQPPRDADLGGTEH